MLFPSYFYFYFDIRYIPEMSGWIMLANSVFSFFVSVMSFWKIVFYVGSIYFKASKSFKSIPLAIDISLK
jgi:hypothetical protein